MKRRAVRLSDDELGTLYRALELRIEKTDAEINSRITEGNATACNLECYFSVQAEDKRLLKRLHGLRAEPQRKGRRRR